MLGVFVARDIILFYVFFEFTLIPLFFLIGIWGSQERQHAAVKFFLFTLAGSLLTFLGLLGDRAVELLSPRRRRGHRRTDVLHPAADRGPAACGRWTRRCKCGVFLALLAGFAIKVPLFPLHTWLPLAHVEAPTAGSVILAGVLLKVGTYGFARFNVPMLPTATATLMPWLLWMSLAGIVYGALVALAQHDIKRLIAYSSVSHLGFCMLGLFALNRLGIQGSVLQMVNHGLSTGGLFAVVGMLYERYHTRQIADLGGLARRLPVLAFFMLVLTLSSIAVPGLNGFVGEFLILLGMFERGWAAAPAADWIPASPDRRAGRERRHSRGLVHAVDVSAGVFRPAPRAGPACDRFPAPRSFRPRGVLPRAAGDHHNLDRLAAAILPRPHGAHAGCPGGAGHAGGRRQEAAGDLARRGEKGTGFFAIRPEKSPGPPPGYPRDRSPGAFFRNP